MKRTTVVILAVIWSAACVFAGEWYEQYRRPARTDCVIRPIKIETMTAQQRKGLVKLWSAQK